MSEERLFFKRVKVEEGCQGGFLVVEPDKRLGDVPVASVNIPLRSKETSRRVAEYIADAINRNFLGLGDE